MQFDFKNFIFPSTHLKSPVDFEAVKICAVVPSFKPEELTVNLVRDLIRWNQNVKVYVVDDCTPLAYEEQFKIFKRIARVSNRVSILRTPANRMKAGAINYGLREIWSGNREIPDVILTLDDDIVIARDTIKNLTTELLSYENLGAACSQCRVLNKNKNFLTRLQGLEYIGYNAMRLADEGFYHGPLVMHGMLTAFRAQALKEVGGFVENHLIEDYEITARLKKQGWDVKSVVHALAWTKVPENFKQLWRQRTRWSYGGITILSQIKYWPAVIQDIIGHGMFLVTLGVIGISFWGGHGTIPAFIPTLIIVLSLGQLVIWYTFQLWLMRLYPEKDRYDWLIRASIIPEFIYANVLTVVLIGSYLFGIFNAVANKIPQSATYAHKLMGMANKGFRQLGYTQTWGTRTH